MGHLLLNPCLGLVWKTKPRAASRAFSSSDALRHGFLRHAVGFGLAKLHDAVQSSFRNISFGFHEPFVQGKSTVATIEFTILPVPPCCVPGSASASSEGVRTHQELAKGSSASYKKRERCPATRADAGVRALAHLLASDGSGAHRLPAGLASSDQSKRCIACFAERYFGTARSFPHESVQSPVRTRRDQFRVWRRDGR